MTFTKDKSQLWNEFLDAEFNYDQARLKLFQAYQAPDLKSKIEILRRDLLDVEKRFFLYDLIKSLSLENQKLLVEELLPLAAMLEHKRSQNPAEVILLSWGDEWLKANLWDIARKVIDRVANGDFKYIDLGGFYSGLIIIFREVDRNKAKELLEEALNHHDADVRATGISWRDDAKW